MLVVADKLLGRQLLADKALARKLQDALDGEVWADSISAVADQDAHVVHLTSLCGLDDESGLRTPPVSDKVMVDHTSGQ